MTNKPDHRPLHKGMGKAVAERTYLRKKENGEWETWGEVADRVALGNALLCKNEKEQEKEFEILRNHIANGVCLMSGRHLQHGDKDQPNKTMELHTNCATSATSFGTFLLLLNGSGVGRSFDDHMMLVNWDNAPNLRCVLNSNHPDFDWSAHESVRDAEHKYGHGRDTLWFKVPDSREGWAKAVEIWENAAFEKIHKDKLFVVDFSDVRPSGAPIGGMQGRPASGPVAFMNALNKCASIKGAGLPRWKQAMFVDHFLGECVVVGGSRRSARMATKYWKDPDILEFIKIKRPLEYRDMDVDEVFRYRQDALHQPMGFLWSANNSVMVDKEFWDLVSIKKRQDGYNSPEAKKARHVFSEIMRYSYGDGTGEPGLINVDQLKSNNDGLKEMTEGGYLQSKRYQVEDDTQLLLKRLAKRSLSSKYNMIVNPCGEVCLLALSGFCVIADVVPYHAETIEEAEDAFRATARALIRVNTMDSIYKKEVERTNRIGIGMTGIHEFAYDKFGYTFYDLIDEEKSKDFWLTISRFSRACYDESVSYSAKLGRVTPHTITTQKPSGSIAKLFGLTEGCHLPAKKFYLRWVQFRRGDPMISEYESRGYPVKTLRSYNETVIVGFPTKPVISEIISEDKIVTADEVDFEAQYKWLQLLEKYWLRGCDENGEYPDYDYSNQLSYTAKYDPNRISFEEFAEIIQKYQPEVKCCSVMPTTDDSAYEYLPEEPITKIEFEKIANKIQEVLDEDIGIEHIACENDVCPVTFNDGNKSELGTAAA